LEKFAEFEPQKTLNLFYEKIRRKRKKLPSLKISFLFVYAEICKLRGAGDFEQKSSADEERRILYGD
jgi:hypothetical protein